MLDRAILSTTMLLHGFQVAGFPKEAIKAIMKVDLNIYFIDHEYFYDASIS